ncbi:MAG: MFS transporter, partial [Bacteriovoracaceae bacterium]|nr:MFS transporter [Bacteriovoracaceae bacterium]
MRSFFTALLNRAYFALFCTQFLGAFNDNFFRTALAAFVTYKVTTISEESKGQIVSLAVGIFMLPYFLFSALAGELADKLRKDLLIKATKLLEVIIALMIGYGFVTSNVYFLLGVLFLMGTQSTFFGPVKYSILPDILGESQLVAGNGVIEAGTYGAILQGTILGGMIIGAGDIVIPGLGFTLPATEYRLPGIILAVACLGLTVSLFIPRRTPTKPGLVVDKNFLRSTWKNMAYAKQNQNIFLCILGISWFWMLGAVLISLIPILAEQVLKGSPSLFTFLLTLFSCGIGLGSLLCQFLVKGEITSKYVPLSAILMTVFLADLAHTISHYHVWGTMISYQEFWAMGAGKHITLDLLGFALCGGLYVVPLNAMLQFLAEGSSRSRVIAANNIINSLFMVVGCLICAVLNKQGVTLAQIFVLIAVANGLAAIYICGLLPHHIIRMILKKVFKLVYQMQVVGIENWKNLKGTVLIVANHTSFLDAVMLW